MTDQDRRPRSAEAGFTLIEALTSVLLLSFGLMAVSNLFLVAGTSNQIANQSTAAVAAASETLERLKAIPFDQLTPGGSVTDDVGVTDCEEPAADCVVAGNYNSKRSIYGVGIIKTRWQIVDTATGGASTYFIRVRSQAIGTIAASRSRSEFTSFRVCTSTGCP